MSQIETLCDFLNSTDARFRIYDMGRRISKVSSSDFQRFEQNITPYHSPLMQHAFVGILIWDPKQPDQHLIWFLKFPLDEQGKLVFAARDDFLKRLATTVGSQLLNATDAQDDPLKDNPFSFTPDQEKMAAFHALASQVLGQAPSSFYQPARDYMSGLKGYDNWQAVGLQGIADMVARLDQDSNESLLTRAVPRLPYPPLEAVCINLENHKPRHALYQALAERLKIALQDEQCTANTLGALIRGLSQCSSDELLQEAVESALNSCWGTDIELLAAIGSRAWQSLNFNQTRRLFFEKLAQNSAGQASFNAMTRDLLFMPGLRILIMDTFRSAERSDALSQAIGGLFGAGQATQH